MIYSELKSEVHKRVKKDTIEKFISILNNLNNKKYLKFWGTEKGRGFIKKVVYAGFFHDLYKWSYNDVAKACKSFLKIAGSSLAHNHQLVRKTLYEYCLKKIEVGEVTEWNKNARNIPKSNSFSDVNLWIDSSDFPIAGANKTNTKDLMWSWKLNKLGARFMVICDGKNKIRFISPYYSPKLYDGHWVQMNKFFLEQNFQEAVFIGDSHFEQGKNLFDNISFVTPVQGVSEEQRSDGEVRPSLNQKSINFNTEHRRIRAKIENPFGTLEKKYKILEEPFNERLLQLEYLVVIGCFILNFENNN